MAYLMSDSFGDLVEARGASKASAFRQLKEAFYFGDNPIGKNVICPRGFDFIGCTCSHQH